MTAFPSPEPVKSLNQQDLKIRNGFHVSKPFCLKKLKGFNTENLGTEKLRTFRRSKFATSYGEALFSSLNLRFIPPRSPSLPPTLLMANTAKGFKGSQVF